MGSFLLCQAYRIVHHEKWWTGRSHCDSCGHVLGVMDLIPILSWIGLKGKCRYCGKKIPVNSVLYELGTGILFAGYTAYYGKLDFHLVGVLILICCLIGLSTVDYYSYEIPDGYILAGIVGWIVSILGDFSVIRVQILSGICIAGGILLLSVIMDHVLHRESMGGGDIKLYFLVSLFLGPFAGILNVLLSCVIGLIFAVILKQEKIPFGPSISLSTTVCLFIGNACVQWYLCLLGI